MRRLKLSWETAECDSQWSDSAMATNSVRRIFMDATREQGKIMAAATSGQNCSCNTWNSSSSSTTSSTNPPVTMMARFVREDDKSSTEKKTSWS